MRTLFALPLIAAGCLSAIVSWGPLRNLFSGYRDSPIWVYLLFGLPFLALAAAAFASAVWLLRRS